MDKQTHYNCPQCPYLVAIKNEVAYCGIYKYKLRVNQHNIPIRAEECNKAFRQKTCPTKQEIINHRNKVHVFSQLVSDTYNYINIPQL